MSHSQFHCTGREYLDLHGLIFETSICYWQDQPGSLPRRRCRASEREALRARAAKPAAQRAPSERRVSSEESLKQSSFEKRCSWRRRVSGGDPHLEAGVRFLSPRRNATVGSLGQTDRLGLAVRTRPGLFRGPPPETTPRTTGSEPAIGRDLPIRPSALRV